MSLTSALNIAQSALANSAAQSAILSQNIANVSNPNYSLETAGTVTQGSGAVSIGATQRATSTALLANLLSSQSASASSSALNNGLQQIAGSLGLESTASTSTTSATDDSPATLIGAFADALQAYQAQPDDPSLGAAALAAAKAVVSGLNAASSTVQSVREQADSDMAASVSTINALLAQFQTVNTQIVIGTKTGTDVSDAENTRDGILKQLSNEIGITTVPAASGGTAIYTDSGATLFETTARAVNFTPTSSLTAGTTGGAVTVDRVPVTGPSAVMPIQSGALAGLATLRDDATVSYQNQLDQMASSLVTTFAETNTTTNPATTTNGLFTAAGLTTTPTSQQTTGLAENLAINASFDPSSGGSVTALRDGASVNYNTGSDAAYSGRLQQLTTALAATRTFDGHSGGAASGTLATYAASSVSWLEASRQTSTSALATNTANVSATTTALSNATGVNLDDQMSQMLDVEHAYQASAQLMNTVNTMYTALLQAFN